MRIHCLENVEKSLAFLDKLNVHLENIGAHDIVDGNSRIILGLIWIIILRFQVQNISVIEKVRRTGQEVSVGQRRCSTEALLLWCKAKTQGYSGVSVSNFTSSWRDGMAFNALIHKHRPDLIDFDALSPDDPLRNLHIAFTTAENCLGIPKLLDPEDVFIAEPEEKSIITYLGSYYHYFARKKANSLHARRIERVVNHLRHFINDVKEYEKSASKLLQWIHESITRLNGTSTRGDLEGLRLQLAELSRFRTQEKPPHFYEKGELEVALFVIRNKMIAIGIRAYVPPRHLQISEVNKAWKLLEHSEYKTWLNLNEEMKRQEMIDQLFLKFETKCAMREIWLTENQQIAEQEVAETTQYGLQSALKKYEAFEADVFAYEDRIELIVQIAEEFKRCQYYREHLVITRSNKVVHQWRVLLETIKNRRLAIQQRIFHKDCHIEFGCLMKYAADLKRRIDQLDPYGESFEQIQQAFMRIEAIDMELKNLYTQMDNFLSKNRNGYAEEFEKEWTAMAEQVILLAEEKRREIELKNKQWQNLPEISIYRNYIRDTIQFLGEVEFQLSYNVVNRIHRQIGYIEDEIASKQKKVDTMNDIMNDEGSKHNKLLIEFTASRGAFNKMLESIKNKAVLAGDALFLNGEIEDAVNLIDEKAKILGLEDVDHIDTAVRINQKLLEEVEFHFREVENISDKAMTLKEDCREFDRLSNDFVDCIDKSVLIQSLSKVKKEIDNMLTEKPKRMLQAYVSLVDNVKRKQAYLIDAFSIKQFVSNSTQALVWIADKATIIGNLKPLDMDTIYKKGASIEIPEEFLFVERIFTELEGQMITMAEMVSYSLVLWVYKIVFLLCR